MGNITIKTVCASAVAAALALFSLQAQDFGVGGRLARHVSYLASDSLRGRASGSEYEKMAAAYVWDSFRESGLEMLCGRDGDEFTVNLPGGPLVSRNVAGVVPGYDPVLRNRYIVVGAHVDNIGENVMTVDGREVRQIYNGADDNASGVAVLAELARIVSEYRFMFRRSVVFVAFGASEKMQSGAWYFINRSFADSSSVDMMVNLDMLGRGAREGNRFEAYTASNPDMNALVAKVSDALRPVRPAVIEQDYYPGDHRVFLHRGIPSVLFTTGAHPECRTVRDDESLMDYETMAAAVDYIYHFVLEAAGHDKSPAHVPALEEAEDEADVYSMYECDQRPSFFNGNSLAKFLSEWVYVYVKYPQEAVDKGIQGTVTVSFVVEKSGEVTGVRVEKGVHPLLDAEAVKVVSVSPRWKPGKISGEKVRVRISVPVEFRLAKGREGRFGF